MRLRSRELLIQYLEAFDLSERQLARSAGLGHATVNHLVTGRRSTCTYATASAIEHVLNCQLGTLFMAESSADPLAAFEADYARANDPQLRSLLGRVLATAPAPMRQA